MIDSDFANAQTDWAAALLDPGRPVASGLTAWNNSDAAVRFAVHRNNVMSSLIDALAQTFPVVQALVGVEFFRAMAGAFIRSFPPTSRILAFYGARFPEFLSTFEPARAVPYLRDVAALEMARVKAYHAADVQPVAEAEVVVALNSGDAIQSLQFVLHPSLTVLGSGFAAVSVWAAHQTLEEADLGGLDINEPESALVFRKGMDVIVMPVSAGTASFVSALSGGVPLGEAADQAEVRCPEFELTEVLGFVFYNQLVVSIKLSLED